MINIYLKIGRHVAFGFVEINRVFSCNVLFFTPHSNSQVIRANVSVCTLKHNTMMHYSAALCFFLKILDFSMNEYISSCSRIRFHVNILIIVWRLTFT